MIPLSVDSVRVDSVRDFGSRNRDVFRRKVERAKRQRDLSCPRKKVAIGPTEEQIYVYEPYSLIETSVDDLKEYGLGIYLYFKILKFLAITFLILAVFAVPLIFINLSASPGPESESSFSFEKFTLGNLYNAHPRNISSLPKVVNATMERYVSLAGYPVTLSKINVIYGLLDMCYCIVFLGAVIHLRRKVVADAIFEKRKLNPSIYTVQVEGFDDKFCDRGSLAEFFSHHYGEVADVAFHCNDANVLDLFRQRGKLKSVEAAMMPLSPISSPINSPHRNGVSPEPPMSPGGIVKRRLEKVDVKIREMQTGSPKIRTMIAYVVFERAPARAECLRKHSPYLFGGLCTKDRFDDQELTIIPAPPPSSLLYDSLDSGGAKLWGRRFMGALAILGVCLLSFALLFPCMYFTKRSPNRVLCPSSLNRTALFNSSFLESCYCRQPGVDWNQETNINCRGYQQEFITAKSLLLLSGLFLTGVNFLVRKTVIRLASFERYRNLEERNINVLRKILFFSLLNTTGILLLVFGRRGADDTALPFLLNGIYTGFPADWYNVVGVCIHFFLLFNVLFPHISPMLYLLIQFFRRSYCLREDSTQEDLNDIFSGAEMDVCERYAALMHTVFISLFYSSAMPSLLPVAAFTLMASYWTDKAVFLRLYRTPPPSDHQLAMQCLEILPWGIILHLFMGLMFYSSPLMDPLVDFTGSSAYQVLSQMALERTAVVPLFVLLIIVLFGQILRHLFGFSLCGAMGVTNHDLEVEASDEIHLPPWSRNDSLWSDYHPHTLPQYKAAFVRTPSGRQLAPQPPLRVLRPSKPPTTAVSMGSEEADMLNKRSRAANAMEQKRTWMGGENVNPGEDVNLLHNGNWDDAQSPPQESRMIPASPYTDPARLRRRSPQFGRASTFRGGGGGDFGDGMHGNMLVIPGAEPGRRRTMSTNQAPMPITDVDEFSYNNTPGPPTIVRRTSFDPSAAHRDGSLAVSPAPPVRRTTTNLANMLTPTRSTSTLQAQQQAGLTSNKSVYLGVHGSGPRHSRAESRVSMDVDAADTPLLGPFMSQRESYAPRRGNNEEWNGGMNTSESGANLMVGDSKQMDIFESHRRATMAVQKLMEQQQQQLQQQLAFLQQQQMMMMKQQEQETTHQSPQPSVSMTPILPISLPQAPSPVLQPQQSSAAQPHMHIQPMNLPPPLNPPHAADPAPEVDSALQSRELIRRAAHNRSGHRRAPSNAEALGHAAAVLNSGDLSGAVSISIEPPKTDHGAGGTHHNNHRDFHNTDDLFDLP